MSFKRAIIKRTKEIALNIESLINGKYREFFAYENKDREQIYRLELAQYENEDIAIIIKKVNYLKTIKIIKSPTYKNFISGENDFGRLRIGDFRIFVHRETSKIWILLHIFRKTTSKNPVNETNKALTRLKEYKSQPK